MKLLFSIIAVFMLALPNVNASEDKSILLRKTGISIDFVGEIGRPEKDCRGIGLGCLGVVITIEFGAVNGRVTESNNVIFSKNDDKFITLQFITNESNPSLDLTIDKEFVLDSKISEAFDRSHISLNKGVYKVSKLADGQYSVTIPISVK